MGVWFCKKIHDEGNRIPKSAETRSLGVTNKGPPGPRTSGKDQVQTPNPLDQPQSKPKASLETGIPKSFVKPTRTPQNSRKSPKSRKSLRTPTRTPSRAIRALSLTPASTGGENKRMGSRSASRTPSRSGNRKVTSGRKARHRFQNSEDERLQELERQIAEKKRLKFLLREREFAEEKRKKDLDNQRRQKEFLAREAERVKIIERQREKKNKEVAKAAALKQQRQTAAAEKHRRIQENRRNSILRKQKKVAEQLRRKTYEEKCRQAQMDQEQLERQARRASAYQKSLSIVENRKLNILNKLKEADVRRASFLSRRNARVSGVPSHLSTTLEEYNQENISFENGLSKSTDGERRFKKTTQGKSQIRHRGPIFGCLDSNANLDK